jgi:hypothetical protein
MQTSNLLISLSVVLVLRLWQSGVIQAIVNRQSLRLPKWAQPIPPIALTVLTDVVVWLVQGTTDQALTDRLVSGGVTGVVTVGLYHVAKRWTPAGLVGKVSKATKGSAVLLVLLVAGCSSTRVDPTVPSADRLVTALRGAVALVDGVAEVAIASLPADCSEETAQLARDVVAGIAEADGALDELEAGRGEVCAAAGKVLDVARLTVPLAPSAVRGEQVAVGVRELAGCK